MKKTIMDAMNRNGHKVSDEEKLIDMVLTIVEFKQIIKELQEAGLFVDEEKQVHTLQVA